MSVDHDLVCVIVHGLLHPDRLSEVILASTSPPACDRQTSGLAKPREPVSDPALGLAGQRPRGHDRKAAALQVRPLHSLLAAASVVSE